jgi:hypothetical protein
MELRRVVRATAGKILRSDILIPGELATAVQVLLDNPNFGNPHAVHCDWCRESRTLFRDENDGPFKLTPHGWLCEACDVRAASQEIRF